MHTVKSMCSMHFSASRVVTIATYTCVCEHQIRHQFCGSPPLNYEARPGRVHVHAECGREAL